MGSGLGMEEVSCRFFDSRCFHGDVLVVQGGVKRVGGQLDMDKLARIGGGEDLGNGIEVVSELDLRCFEDGNEEDVVEVQCACILVSSNVVCGVILEINGGYMKYNALIT